MASTGHQFTVTSNERLKSAQTRFVVDENLAKLSPVLLRMTHMQSDRALQLKSVDAMTLSLIRDWLEHHRNDTIEADGRVPRDSWDKKFIEKVSAEDLLYELIMAAHHLRIIDLVDLACEAFARTLNAPAEGLRMKFNIEDNFTLDERELVTRELGYCYENRY